MPSVTIANGNGTSERERETDSIEIMGVPGASRRRGCMRDKNLKDRDRYR